ncbi:MAG: extracellular solute-binding protein [Phycisphaerae bacterium]|nr:extracellular solute-binding protein [Phycisphaerae bacterium]
MNVWRGLIVAMLAVILGVPFVARRAAEQGRAPTSAGARTLIVVSPHIQQIKSEFETAFNRWHQARWAQPVRIDWRYPGGTTEILNQLRSEFEARMRDGRISADGRCQPGTIGFDVMMGGGSFEFGRLKRGVTMPAASLPRAGPSPGGADASVTVPMSVPAGFSKEQLDEWYGANRIGAEVLYDPDQYWLGTALSAFGIVYNRDLLRDRGLPEPKTFVDLTSYQYRGLIALADPRQSGSVATAYDSILNNRGWDEGWRILREMSANARYFATASTSPPFDVSQGEAAAGVAIDFYGRGQAQAILRSGERPEDGRVGYVDPKGAAYIDADPVAILRGGPDPELAKRFVEFCLSEEAQALWQFRARGSNEGGGPGDGLGPERYELRRMPVRRIMYEKHLDRFVDRVNPFELASATAPRGWRDAIGPLMGAFGVDTSLELRAAWDALNAARSDASFPPDVRAEMERLFYAMPMHRTRDGREVPFSPESLKEIVADTRRWTEPVHGTRSKIAYTKFFQCNYQRVARCAHARSIVP